MKILQLLQLTVLGTLGITVKGAGGRLKTDYERANTQYRRTKALPANARGEDRDILTGSPDLAEHRRRIQEEYPDCDPKFLHWVGDGFCDKDPEFESASSDDDYTGVDDDHDDYRGWDEYNSERCGWDGGDCCLCSCERPMGFCGYYGFQCLDPANQTCDNGFCRRNVCEGTDRPFPIDEFDRVKKCDGPVCTEAECCAAAFCDESVCEGTDLPFPVNDGDACEGLICTAAECCEAAAVCEESVCDTDVGILTIFVGAGKECDREFCTPEECCESGYPDCRTTSGLRYIGDGRCSSYTNTEECGWDRGDCCPCSCKDRDSDQSQCGRWGWDREDCLDPENQTCDGFCDESVCEGTDRPFFEDYRYGKECDGGVCTAAKCCLPAGVCDESDCEGLMVLVDAEKKCDGISCTEEECCELRTWNEVVCFLGGDEADTLDLTDWDFTDDDIDSIKECLLKLKDDGQEIRVLILSRNELEILPVDLFENASSLVVLKLDDNKIKTLPPGIFSMLSSLVRLFLHYNELDDDSMVVGVFGGLASLEKLDLKGNDITTLPLGILEDMRSTLEELDLARNDLARLPVGLIEELTSLEDLDLTDNDGLECLPSVCPACSADDILDINGDQLDLQEENTFCAKVATACFLGGDKADTLDLTDVNLTDDDIDSIKECLLKLKDDGQEIRVLILSENELEILPVDLFENASSLVVLRLNDNKIKTLPPGIFSMLSSLVRLFLDDNDLDDDSMVVGVFGGLASLEKLNLKANDITTLPLGILEDMRSTLEELNLGRNDLVRLPVGLIEELTSLEDLDLTDNDDLECLPSVCPACSADDILDINGDQLDLQEENTFCCADNDDCNVDGDICCPARQVCEAPSDVNPGACGDPHMTGFRGQKFDFTGDDGGWYSVLSALPDIHLNMRVTSPVPSVPEITYITGISIIMTDADGVEHTIVISVSNPHSLESKCPEGQSPCLADGALSVEIDGNATLLAPGEFTLGPNVAIAAVNLPGACRSFGFEKYWERKKAEYTMMRRRLSEQNGLQDMSEWILGDPTATNMEECAEYVADATAAGGDIGLFSHESEHTSFQILTPVGRIRLSHGRLHQLAMRDPTDHFDLPDHLTWQMNLALDYHELDESVTRGILGETLVPTVDASGKPIMHGMGSIRGSEEDYHVEGPQATRFAQDIRHG